MSGRPAAEAAEQRMRPSAVLDFLRRSGATLHERNCDPADMDTLLECLWPRDRTKHPTPEERQRAADDMRAVAALYLTPGLPTQQDPRLRRRLKDGKKQLQALARLFSTLAHDPNADLLVSLEIGEHLDDAVAATERLAPAPIKGPKTVRLPMECIFLLGDVYRDATGKEPASSTNSRNGYTPFVRFVHVFAYTFGWDRSEDQVARDTDRAWKADPARFKNG